MNIRDFQYINSLNSGSTTYESDIINYFKISVSKTPQEISEELEKIMNIKEKEIKKNFIKIGNKKYLLEKDFLDCSYEQWIRLDQLMADNDNIKNLHKLLAIYIRPKKWFKIEKYKLERQEVIANELLNMNIEDALGCLVFFYRIGMNSFKNIQISYLNQTNQAVFEVPMKKKLFTKVK